MKKRITFVLLVMVIVLSGAFGMAYAGTVERFKVSDKGLLALFNYGDFFSGGTLFGDTQILLKTGVQRLDGDKTPFVVLEYFTHEETLNPLLDIIDINELLEFSCDHKGQCVSTNSTVLSTMSYDINGHSASIKADLLVFERVSGAIIPATVDIELTRTAPYVVTNTNEHFASDGVQTIIRFKSKSAPATVTGIVTLETIDVSTLNNGGTLFNFVNGEMTVIKGN